MEAGEEGEGVHQGAHGKIELSKTRKSRVGVCKKPKEVGAGETRHRSWMNSLDRYFWWQRQQQQHPRLPSVLEALPFLQQLSVLGGPGYLEEGEGIYRMEVPHN